MANKPDPRKPTHPEVTWRAHAETRKQDANVRVPLPAFMREVLDALQKNDDPLNIPDVSHTTVLRTLLDRADVQEFLRDDAGFDDRRIKMLKGSFTEIEAQEQIGYLTHRIEASAPVVNTNEYDDGYATPPSAQNERPKPPADDDDDGPAQEFRDLVTRETIRRTVANGATLTAPETFMIMLNDILPNTAEAIGEAMSQHAQQLEAASMGSDDAGEEGVASAKPRASKRAKPQSRKDTQSDDAPDAKRIR